MTSAVSDERSKEPTGESLVPNPGESKPAPRMDLPAWGQGKSKRRRNQPPSEDGAALPEGVPSFDAVDRGVARVGRPMFNHVFLVVGGLIVVAALIAGIQYWRGQGQAGDAASTRALAKGLAPLARGQVVPEGEDMPKVANDPLARTRKELLDQADTALRAAAAGDDPAALAAKMAQASLAMRQGDPKAASQGFSDFLANAGPDHPLRAAAAEGLALALEQSGDLNGALGKLNALPSPLSVRQLWHRGRILAALGKKNEAEADLKKASAEPQTSLEARLAKSLLATLGQAPAETP